jgi:hypothetical protein
MKQKNSNATKPIIFLTFLPDETVEWRSFGWGDDKVLMVTARNAIGAGETREEVVELLKQHFDVEELLPPK